MLSDNKTVSPFGMVMSGRSYSSPVYRYGYNGQEKDDEVSGEGNTNTAEYWEYNTRLGRRWNIDPLTSKYPGMSPYAFCYNSPINVVDLDGREGIVVSGSPGDHKNRDHFLINGLDRAKAAQKHTQRQGEGITWMVYNDKENGYTKEQIDVYTKKAAESGIVSS